ncbi:hypothetical protein H2204_006500 [Knufia peltigerae]|uniref:Xaa-Pro dipeptidyl-peptidase C-terminal domain-containing protein n=1 Tax=Knufia peltigerae TaxID=1002370 RepID=A0AA38Y424_9EURO|nr:hypothetical protein H2204_006500 [Knufia peltigerae]
MAGFTVRKVKLPTPETYGPYVYSGFKPGTTILKAGHVKSEGRRPFGCDTAYDRDSAVPMRDGVKLCTDVFRPADSEINQVPAVLLWGPYGKTGNGLLHYENMGPHNCGVPRERVSGYHKFEGLDPAEWSERGYAIVNIDSRGIGDSEGDAIFWGQQEAEDIYDTISWINERPWSNGSVVMAGNSWLAIAQINFASRLKHPALKAIAPWEGATDIYQQSRCRGGAPQIAKFNQMIMASFAGRHSAEDMPTMTKEHPLYDDYWASKRVHVSRIDCIPVYLTASYSSMLHGFGSFESFLTMETKDKWLRVHPYQEWHDLYRADMNDDLQRFYDRYAKGLQNGWEETPRVRLSLLAMDGSKAKSIIERPTESYPPPGFDQQVLHLNASTFAMQESSPKDESQVSYPSHNLSGSADFTYTFLRACELSGYPLVSLHISTASAEDMDVHIQLRKLSVDGELLVHHNYPTPTPIPPQDQTNVSTYLGGTGMLRASHRVSIEPQHYLGDQPFYRHDCSEPVPVNTVVRLEIPMWPIGMVFAAGEGIMLRVSGHSKCLPETKAMTMTEPEDHNPENGVHVVHTGGEYDSFLRIPIRYT